MKKVLLLIISIFFICGCEDKPITFKKKEENSTLKANMNVFEYGELYKINDIFDNKDITLLGDYLDTSKLGDNEVDIEYQIEDTIYSENFKYRVNDTTAPLIWMSSSLSITVGDTESIVNKIICADNYDKNPSCYIEGVYDAHSVGSYPLKVIAIDANGNKSENAFTLHVKEKGSSSGNNNSNNTAKTNIADVIAKYKTDDVLVGIDVSKYQGNIDWKKVKASGVEFAIIRLGLGYDDVLKLDEYFKANIEGALANGIKVGIYFYSYAVNTKEAISHANYVLENIKDYDVTLPIAWDWENFKYWNEFGISMYDLRSMSYAYQDVIKKAGYTPVQYGSKTYLNAFWKPFKYDVWLAIYTINMNPPLFDDNFIMWQLSNTGRVPGINGDVDLDLYYLNK